jgi:hypothetical protein
MEMCDSRNEIPVARWLSQCPNVMELPKKSTEAIQKFKFPSMFYRFRAEESVRGTQIGSENVRKLIPLAFV